MNLILKKLFRQYNFACHNMAHIAYNKKRIFWESKTKQIWLIEVSFPVKAAAIWKTDKYGSFIFLGKGNFLWWLPPGWRGNDYLEQKLNEI